MEKYSNRIIKLFKDVQKEHGENNHLIMIPKIISRTSIGYSTMKFDFELIKEFSKILSENNNNNNYIGSTASYSIIALYGKCFTSSDNGYPKLEEKEIFKNKPELVNAHKYLMDLRNRFIAHRTEHIDELGIAYLSIDKETKRTEIRYSLMKMSVISPKKMEVLQSLFEHVNNTILEKLDKSGTKTYKGLLSKYSPEELEKFKFDQLGK